MNFLTPIKTTLTISIFVVVFMLAYNKAHAETSIPLNNGELTHGMMSLGKLPAAISATSSQSGIISYKMPSVTGRR